jgi:hypothetical protein
VRIEIQKLSLKPDDSNRWNVEDASFRLPFVQSRSDSRAC